MYANLLGSCGIGDASFDSHVWLSFVIWYFTQLVLFPGFLKQLFVLFKCDPFPFLNKCVAYRKKIMYLRFYGTIYIFRMSYNKQKKLTFLFVPHIW